MKTIEAVPATSRNLHGIDFFLLWSGAAVSLAEIWAGGLLVPLGLTAGLAVILIGHLIGNTPLALGGIIGSETGLPTMVAARPSFGVRGSFLPTVLNLIQLVGWTGVMLWIGGHAAEAVWPSPLGGARGWIVLAGLITTLWAIVGHRFWKWLQRIAVSTLIILCAVMTAVLFQHHGWQHLVNLVPEGDSLPFMVGLDLVIAMPISWLPLVCDYSRYADNSRRAFWGTWIGYFLLSSWMYFVGLAAALATSSATPETMVLELMVHVGLALPAVIIVLLSTFTTTFLDIYSTAVSSLNIWPDLDERLASGVCGLLGTILALVFPATAYENFLLLVGSVFCPLFGVILADFFLFDRTRYAAAAGQTEGTGPNPRDFNPYGFLAWGLGCVAYHGIQSFTTLGSSVPSLVLSGLVYWLLSKAGHRSRQLNQFTIQQERPSA